VRFSSSVKTIWIGAGIRGIDSEPEHVSYLSYIYFQPPT